MKKLASFTVKYRYFLFALFIAAAAVSAWASQFVNVNYDITKYLPGDSATSAAFSVMEDQFGNIGYAQMMAKDVTAAEAEDMLGKIKEIAGVDSVMFDADDKSFYKDGCALFKIYLKNNDFTAEASQTLEDIEALFPEKDIAFSGYAAESGFTRDSIKRDCMIILIMALAVVLLILLFTSRSWADQLVFAIGIGVALIINIGTNSLFNEISFVSDSVCAVLQLALAMDYSIIVLHRYDEEREKTDDKCEAMKNALAGCFTSVSAASFTTVAGLVAIMCMRFSIGLDIGLVLSKGIICSLLMSFFFLPCVILMFDKLLIKTKHAQLIPKTDKIASFAYKTRKIIPAIALVVFIICGFVQAGLTFVYDIEINKDSDVYKEREEIYRVFGEQNPLIILVPNGDTEKEKEVVEYVKGLEYKGEKVISYGTGLASTGLYDRLTAKDAAERYGTSEETLKGAYTALGGENGSVIVYDLLEYMAENDYITAYAEGVQGKIDSLASVITEASGVFDSGKLSSFFGISQAESYALIYNAKGNLFGDKTLLTYEAIEQAYALTGDAALAEYHSLIQQAFTELSADGILADPTASLVFDREEVKKLFDYYSLDPATDKLNEYQILAYVCENRLVTKKLGLLFETYQKTCDEKYEEAKMLFNPVTVEQAASLFGVPENQAFAVFCTAFPETAGDFTVTMDEITLIKSDVQSLFGLGGEDTDKIFSSCGSGDNVSVASLIDYACKNRVSSVIGAEKQASLDKLWDDARYAAEKLKGSEYSRLVFNISAPIISDKADFTVETLRSALGNYYDDFYILGSSVNSYDVRATFSGDLATVNIVSIFAVFVIVLLSFGSASIPAVLVTAIEGAIFVNLSIDTVLKTPIYFVCYLIAICIQMGATIDYAILLTDRYINNRTTLNVKDSIKNALNVSIATILSSGLILIIAAGIVWFIATVPLISSIGMLISKGAMISVFTVIFILPQTLCLLDRFIEKLSRNRKFYSEK